MGALRLFRLLAAACGLVVLIPCVPAVSAGVAAAASPPPKQVAKAPPPAAETPEAPLSARLARGASAYLLEGTRPQASRVRLTARHDSRVRHTSGKGDERWQKA